MNFITLLPLQTMNMIKNLLLITALFLTTVVYAQNALPNPGFENWTSVSNYEDPDDWHTLNAQTAFVGVLTAQKASGADAHSGSFALHLTTKSVFGQTANGLATTGTIDVQNQTITGGLAYTLRPDSISGWFKCAPVSGDNGFVDFVLLDNANDTVGFADFTTPTTSVSAYTYFSVPIIYRSGATPALSRTTLSSSAGYNSVVNSTMYIDDLALIFNPNKVAELPAGDKASFSFLNSSMELLVMTSIEHRKTIHLYDSNGKLVFSAGFDANIKTFQLSFLATGIYMIQLNDEVTREAVTGKVVVN